MGEMLQVSMERKRALTRTWPSLTASHACDAVWEALPGLRHQLSIPVVALTDVPKIRITVKSSLPN